MSFTLFEAHTGAYGSSIASQPPSHLLGLAVKL